MRQNGFSIRFAMTALFGLGIALSQTAFAQNYQAIDLGTLSGGGFSIGNAINNAGQVAGAAGTGALDIGNVEIPHAFVWTKGHGMKDIGTLPGGVHSTATAINNAGMVAGYSDDNNGDPHAFLWMAGFGMVNLGTLPGGTTSYATAISAGGDVVGYADDGSGHVHAFRWYVYDADPSNPAIMPVAIMADLGTLPGGLNSWAQGINANGQVVGYSEVAGGAKRGFIWDSVNGMQSIGLLPGGSNSFASQIDDAGVVAGIGDNGAGIPHAISWSIANGMQDMGTFATLNTDPASASISPNGQFAGFLGSSAFLWKNGQLNNLSAYFSGSAPTWTGIAGINDRMEIAGNSATHAYIVTANVALASVQCSPTSVTGGSTATVTITLNGAAPAGGVVVMLSSDSKAAKTPTSVVFQPGVTSVSFQTTTTPVKANVTATFTASLNGATQTATLQVKAPVLVGINLNAGSVQGGYQAPGTVTLSGPAPAGGIIVNVTDNVATATGPGAITVFQGMQTAAFNIKTKPVAHSTPVTITAQSNGVSKTVVLTVLPAPKGH